MARRRPLVLCIGNQSNWSRYKAPLEAHGYDVVAVTGTGEGSSVLKKFPVDAVILDLEALGINGSAVVRRLKEIKSYIPVLLLVSAFTKIPSGGFPAADVVMFTTDVPSGIVGVLDNLLGSKFAFFTRWFGNWKHRAGA